MKRTHQLFIPFLFLASIISVGFSSWLIPSGENKTATSMKNEVGSAEATLTIHQRKNYLVESGIKYDYYIPETIDNNSNVYATFDIRNTDANGNKSTEKYLVDSTYEKYSNSKKSPDEQTVYYDFYDETYHKMTQHSTSYGPKNIKSLEINVTNWKTANEGEYGLVWRVKANDGILLKFEGNNGCKLKGINNTYSVGDVVSGCEEKEVYRSEPIIEGKFKKTEVIYQRVTVYKTQDVDVSKKQLIVHYYHYQYFPQFEQRKVVITEEISGHEDNALETKIKVKKGSKISPLDLKINNYTQCGFYATQEYDTFFDFTKPINEDGDIYVNYFEDSTGVSHLNNAISSLNKSTLNVYDGKKGGSGGDFDISTDSRYSNGNLFLSQTTIASGNTVNMTYGASECFIAGDPETTKNYTENYVNHRTASDDAICVEYDGNIYNGLANNSNSVVLNGDLTVKGKMVIGAKIGAYTNLQMQSYIIGNYCLLNLYGHNLVIDGGTVVAYGMIVDTIGTGKIIIKNGGTLKGTMTVSDAKGSTQMILGISKRQTPFTEYRLSYITAPILIYNQCSLIGYFKLDFGNDFGIANSFLNIIAPSNSIFVWNDNDTSSYILYEPRIIQNLYDIANTTIYKQLYYLRNVINIYANVRVPESVILNISVTFANMNLDADIDFVRIDIPISPFFDIRVMGNRSLDLYSKLIFYPGSSFYSDYESTVNFKVSSTKAKEYATIEKGALGKNVTIYGETRYVAGGLFVYELDMSSSSLGSPLKYTQGLCAQTSYWKLDKLKSSCINGNVAFDTSINTNVSTGDGFYFLSGNIQISESALKTMLQSKALIKTYDIKADITSGFLFDGTRMNGEYQYESATSYHILPLLSGDKAFVIDSQHSAEGKFSNKTGVFSAKYSLSLDSDSNVSRSMDSSLYFLKTDDDMYEEGSNPSDQSSRVDREVGITTIDSATYSEKYSLFKDSSGQLYARIAGVNVRVLDSNLAYSESSLPSTTIQVTLRKFFSNNNTETNTSSSKYDKCKIAYSSSGEYWSYSGFVE